MPRNVSSVVKILVVLGVGMSNRHRFNRLGAARGDGIARAEQPEAKKEAKVRRFGWAIGLKPEMKDRYNDLHAHPGPK